MYKVNKSITVSLKTILLTEHAPIDKNNDSRQSKEVNTIPGDFLRYFQRIINKTMTLDNPKGTQPLRQCARPR
jgi:hypothetical protein